MVDELLPSTEQLFRFIYPSRRGGSHRSACRHVHQWWCVASYCLGWEDVPYYPPDAVYSSAGASHLVEGGPNIDVYHGDGGCDGGGRGQHPSSWNGARAATAAATGVVRWTAIAAATASAGIVGTTRAVARGISAKFPLVLPPRATGTAAALGACRWF